MIFGGHWGYAMQISPEDTLDTTTVGPVILRLLVFLGKRHMGPHD